MIWNNRSIVLSRMTGEGKMFQKNYHITDYQGLPKILDQMEALITDREKAVLFLFDENFVEERFLDMLQEIQTALPGLTVVGMTSHNNVFNHTDNISTDTTFSLLCFEESSFRIVLSDLAKISEHRAALDIVECLKDAEDVKGIFMLSSGSPDHQVIMDRILRENREAVVFGATAAVKNYAMQESASFLIMNDRIYRRAVLCVIF